MPAIEVRDLVKTYGQHQAIKGISFAVEEGELFAFLGENGAGKSTTINILCTILQKTSGSVSILGPDIDADADAIRREIGIVFQNSILDDRLTVAQNLYTRCSYYGLSRREIAARIEPFRRPFDLDGIMGRDYGTLSGGQRRRVDIVRALLHQPHILFLDEPTTGLDPRSRRNLWDYLTKLRNSQKMTLFLTAHYMEEADDADHMVIMDQGRVIEADTGALESLVQSDDIDSPVNGLLLAGILGSSVITVPFGTLRVIVQDREGLKDRDVLATSWPRPQAAGKSSWATSSAPPRARSASRSSFSPLGC